VETIGNIDEKTVKRYIAVSLVIMMLSSIAPLEYAVRRLTSVPVEQEYKKSA